MLKTHWYFGWNIVAAAAFLTLLTTGMRLGIGPFFLPIAHDLGFSRSLLAAIVAVGLLVATTTSPTWLVLGGLALGVGHLVVA